MLRKMLEKLNDASTMLAVRAQTTWSELKSDEKGMEVIQVVMLIAVGVLAIGALWAGINGLLTKWWNQIIGVSGSAPSITVPM